MSKADEVLSRISRSIPKELLKGDLTKKIIDRAPEERAREILKHPGVPQKVKNDINKLLESGAFKQEEEVIDEDAIAKIDSYNEKAVREAIQSGELPDPNDDPYIRERNWKMKNRGKEISSYQSFMGAVKAVKDFQLLGNRVLVQVYEPAKKKSAIILPDSAKKPDDCFFAVIFKLGDEIKDKHLEEGKRVIIRKYGFDPIHINDVLFLVGKEDDVLAIMV